MVGDYLPSAVSSAVNLLEVLSRGQSLGRNVATLPARRGHLGLRVEPFTTDDAMIATGIYDRAWATLDLEVEVVAFREAPKRRHRLTPRPDLGSR